MKNAKLILYSVFVILFISCTTDNKFEFDKKQIKKFVNAQRIKQIKAIIVIPLSGCGSCINDMINYSLTDFNKDKIHFILVETNSKLLRNKYQNTKKFNQYFSIDDLLILQSTNVIDVKPVVFLLDDKGEIIEKLQVV